MYGYDGKVAGMASRNRQSVAGTALRMACALVAFALCVGLAGMLAPRQALADRGEYGLAVGKTFKVDGTTYKVTDRGDVDDLPEVTLVKYGSTKKKPVIATVTYKKVVYEVEKIGKGAFDNAKGHAITAVTIGREVDDIAALAFRGCAKLKVIDLSNSDVVELERAKKGFRVDDIDIGKNALLKAGTANLKVKCGSANASYRAAFKQALAKKGLRANAKVVK